MHSQEGIQLLSSGGSPVVRRSSICVLCKLLHEATRQEAAQQLEWSAVGWQTLVLMAETWQRQLYVVQIVRPLCFLFCWSGSFLLIFIVATAALCLGVAAGAALLLVAVLAVV